ncbi:MULTISPECIES: acyltransferase family protein [Rahnella]|uniref:acyltransferase family protein n=1 Tax=Rahnella TaxID=34037 RepID=UPI003D2A2DD5
MSNINETQNKLLHVDGLRGVACFMVVLSHLALIFYPGLHDPSVYNNKFVSFIANGPLAFSYSGTAAVYIFFVLSGFILSHSFMKSGSLASALPNIATKRYFRLAIPATASCIFAYFILSLFHPNTSTVPPWINFYATNNKTLIDAIYSGVVGSFFSQPAKVNPVLWTMKIELIGSFLTYFLCIIISKAMRKWLILLLFSLAFFASQLPQHEKYGYISFILGVWIYTCNFKIGIVFSAILIVLGIYFGGVHYGSYSYIRMINYVRFFLNGEESNAYYLFNFFSGFLICLVVLKNNYFVSFFSKKLFSFMGKVSFTVYLFHLPFIYLIGLSTFNLLFTHGVKYVISVISSSALSILSIYIASIYLYRMIDRPSMRASEKIANIILNSVGNKNESAPHGQKK